MFTGGLSTFANDGGGSGLPPVDFGLYKYRIKHLMIRRYRLILITSQVCGLEYL